MNEVTKIEPVEVPVDIDEVVVSEEAAIKALQEEGFIKLPQGRLSRLAKIGAYVKGTGVFKLQRGQALVNQQRLDEVMRLIQSEIRRISQQRSGGKVNNKIKNMCVLARELGYLSDKLTASQELMVAIEHQQSPAGTHEDDAPVLAFAP